MVGVVTLVGVGVVMILSGAGVGVGVVILSGVGVVILSGAGVVTLAVAEIRSGKPDGPGSRTGVPQPPKADDLDEPGRPRTPD